MKQTILNECSLFTPKVLEILKLHYCNLVEHFIMRTRATSIVVDDADGDDEDDGDGGDLDLRTELEALTPMELGAASLADLRIAVHSTLSDVTYDGVTEGFFETGTEGVMWMIYKDGFTGYEALESIDDGDHLTVWNKDNAVLFDGDIVVDRETGWREYPMNPGHGQQCALGMWIHWVQAGMDPDSWARLFFSGVDEGSNRARLLSRPPKL